MDLPLNGRSYTCYKPDGSCKSRLDRMLVNNEWLSKWPTVFLRGMQHSISDHCPLLLETKERDWGPTPFRFVNAWCSHPNFKEFVTNAWHNYPVQEWSGYRIKEKLKMLKEDLKMWNRDIFSQLDKNIGELKGKIQELDMLDDSDGLEESDII